MNINSKKELKGNRYKCLRVLKGASIEDIPTMRKQLAVQIRDIEGAKMTETDTAFEFNNGQFMLKPKCKKEVVGILDCTKSYATFEGIRIAYTDIKNVFASSFETDFAQYSIHAIL